MKTQPQVTDSSHLVLRMADAMRKLAKSGDDELHESYEKTLNNVTEHQDPTCSHRRRSYSDEKLLQVIAKSYGV